MAPGWPISSSTLWRGAGREDCSGTPTPAAALSPAHHLKRSQKPGKGLQGLLRRAVGALQMEKAGRSTQDILQSPVEVGVADR